MAILETFISLLAPPDCIICGQEGNALCEACEAAEIIPHGERCGICGRLSPGARTCKACRAHSPRHIWIATDHAGAAQKLLQAYKFGHLRAAHQNIALIMADTFRFYNNPAPHNYLVVPIPTATSRRRLRGFDHAELLAQKLAKDLSLTYAPVLGRLGQSRQVGAKRPARLRQTANSYFVRRPDKLASRGIILVDDVVTTGSTLRAATKVLRSAGAKSVDALIFAKRL